MPSTTTVNPARVKARIQSNKTIAYPTDPSIRAIYKAQAGLGDASTDAWSSVGGSNVSAFQWKVYDLVKQIPRGKVTTYAILAQLIATSSSSLKPSLSMPGKKSVEGPAKSSSGSSQAIGGALKNNPFCPVVPCHRVVKTDGTLGGFFGQTGASDGIQLKVDMLAEEGVQATFDASKGVWKLSKDELGQCLWRGPASK